MGPYEYTPLNEEAKEIRLLTLLPDDYDTPIRISIEIAILSASEVPQFEALSYAWGDVSDLTDIFIQVSPSKRSELQRLGGVDTTECRTLSVTSNLFEALKHIRFGDRTRVLWIDAICVDQTNLAERSNQVLRMPDIYTSNKGVVVWLGPESNNSSVAIKAIQHFGSRITVDWDLRSMAPAPESTLDPYSEDVYDAVEPTPQVRLSIDNLLGRAWFERLWIIQEVCLAVKNAHMLCGLVKISYEHFSNGVFYLANWREVLDPQVNRLWVMIEQLLFLSNKGTYNDLDGVLPQTRHRRCSDQRDRIFAILSLVPESERLDIRPDYTVSVAEVFQSVVLQQVKRSSQLNILRSCSMNDRFMDIPTWVPDWSVTSSTESLRTSWASTSAKAYSCFEAQGILAATGRWVTVVNDIRHIFTRPIPKDPQASAKAIGELISAVKGGGTNSSNVDRLHLLCRTLCAAEFAEKYIPATEDFPPWEESIKYIMACDERLRLNTREPPQQSMFARLYLHYINGFSKGRMLVTTTDGQLGLVPQSTEPGDKVCVILGCSSPLILRTADDGSSHKVVGECYLDGIMTGEALLGELPKQWMHVQKLFPEYSLEYGIFLDGNTGQIHVEDPRLGPLPAGWRIGSHQEETAWNWFVNDATGEETEWDPRLEPDMLRARGVELQEFRLV
ncbi:MAG: hypothetical protein Q9170_004011 [Blastenia crenularia]